MPSPDAEVTGDAGPGLLDRGVPPPEPVAPLRAASAREGELLPPPRRPRFHIHTADELLVLPTPTWQLDRHIPANSLVVLYGPPGAGKSFLALAWAMAVARGRPWLEYATERGLVVYVAAEGGGGLGQRLQAYRDAHAATSPVDLLFVRECVNLLATADVNDLLADADAYLDSRGTPATGIPELPGMFVFDTMARVMPGGDENSARDVGLVIAAADAIRQRTGATVLLQHHTQKAGDLERGSSALRGAADAMFAVRNEDGVITLECTKQKDASPIAPRKLQLVPVGPSCVIEPLEAAPIRAGLTLSARTLLETLRDVQMDGGVAVTTWIRASKVPERSAYRAIGAELLPGLYISHGNKRYSLTPLGEIAATGTANTGVVP